ncbi:unnamed protein product, partial [Pocillopora meandrina]
MKVNMEQTSMQPRLPSRVTTKERAWIVVSFAQRSALPQKFLDFCGSFSIYTIEQTSIDSAMRPLRRGFGCQKRSHTIRDFSLCSLDDAKTMMRCLQKEIDRRRTHASKHIQYSIRCKYATHCGTYVVDCKP